MRKMDKVIFVDVEATCWEGLQRIVGQLPRSEESEIIEVGVCLLDLKTLQVSDPAGIFVKPVRTTVSKFCTELTTITQEQLDLVGVPLVDACTRLKKEYDSKNRMWASYGNYDKNIFERNCKELGIGYPFGNAHLNIKGVFETFFGETLGMTRMLERMKMTLEGTHHRGVDDAVNTARAYSKFLERCRPNFK
jgi:inhibitor of KinA sporulation pathway (predicted exonuclease)